MVASTSSKETQEEAKKMALATQKPGQTKEQTKLIAQGIEKGIALYKKQHKAKVRERDKERKKQTKQKNTEKSVDDQSPTPQPENALPAAKTSVLSGILPWSLLLLSWLGFGVYIGFTQ
ncbi:DUF2956 domain-containing protein [Veronia pacifica]|uniref:DUF2956 domain-containing protein n=1 Tax=Veronia pacifica TaxID=1080227 RepID=A0A1C3E9R0_9GAMM|nr:DUF2956 domain-containing protein [Veronia pacifica]ODA29919.1 hypothetical protein A8L45_21175 [Veronia pacifica]